MTSKHSPVNLIGNNEKKRMKLLISFLLLVLMNSCHGQIDDIGLDVPYGQNPKTPSKGSLDILHLIPFDALSIEVRKRDDGKQIRVYSKDNKLFDGWTLQLFNDNEHRFRYTHYADGLADWQIGYFDNGELDHDFHMKNGVNCGSARMWQKGGCLYIDTYFLEGGINHGPAYAWHENCVLSRDALFDKDRMVYEVKFDSEGEIVEKNGAIPDKYK